MSDNTSSSGPVDGSGDFVAAWLKPGDVLYSGGNVPAGLIGMRLHGSDTELLGTHREVGDFGDAIAAHANSPRVEAVSHLAERLVMHVEQRGEFSRLATVLDCLDVDAFAEMLGLFGHHDRAAGLVLAHVTCGRSGGECCEYEHAGLRQTADTDNNAGDDLDKAAREYAAALTRIDE